MKKVALDTNIVVELLNHKLNDRSKLNQYSILYLPITVCGELLFGALNSSKQRSNLKNVNNFIKTCKMLHSDILVAKTYADVRFDLRKKGKPIPENDIWIAATCIANKIPLYTKDAHFSYVEHLKLI